MPMARAPSRSPILKGKSDNAGRVRCSSRERFDKVSESQLRADAGRAEERYQQFFFRVRDDVDQLVEDYFIDFYVLGKTTSPTRG